MQHGSCSQYCLLKTSSGKQTAQLAPESTKGNFLGPTSDIQAIDGVILPSEKICHHVSEFAVDLFGEMKTIGTKSMQLLSLKGCSAPDDFIWRHRQSDRANRSKPPNTTRRVDQSADVYREKRAGLAADGRDNPRSSV